MHGAGGSRPHDSAGRHTGVKVRGATVFSPVRGEWFKVRLELPSASACAGWRVAAQGGSHADDSGRDARRVGSAGRVEHGGSAGDRLEGAGACAVGCGGAAGSAMRKKRRQIGWQVSVEPRRGHGASRRRGGRSSAHRRGSAAAERIVVSDAGHVSASWDISGRVRCLSAS
jgi:hypothetical protein